jgi:DNA topoisomerase-1
MEDLGIGRPSTYASIVSTILLRRYVRKAEQKLVPTELGELVNDRLTRHFPKILDPQFTARMEEELDRVESGEVDWHALLGEFYGPFHSDVERAMREMADVRSEAKETEEKCERCGLPLMKRWGRAGWFLACKGYPKCTFTKDVPGSEGAQGAPLPDVTGQVCPKCGKPMKVRRGRFGAFIACTGYPACKTTRPLPTGVKCPTPGCGGDIIERRTRNGRTYWECTNRVHVRAAAKGAEAAEAAEAAVKTAPSAEVTEATAAKPAGCDFVSWRKPVPKPCPKCGAPFVVETKLRGGTVLVCDDKECGWRAEPSTAPAEAAPGS